MALIGLAGFRGALLGREPGVRCATPHRKAAADTRTPAELLNLIEVKGREVAAALADLRALESQP